MLAYLETQPTTPEVLRFLFLAVGEQVLTFPDISQALQHKIYHLQPMMKIMAGSIGFFDTLKKIVLVGQQREEMRANLPAEKIADYTSALYISLLRNMSTQRASPSYLDEVQILLTFLHSAFRP